ncbi:dihydroorotase [Helcococcus kunzii]|uniref:dihydroorotase n=1 Tax=Helcococcus kunzii TaxID=40091 RepID=UPI0038A5CB99
MLIKNAKLIVKNNETKISDILIEDGKITKIEENISNYYGKIIDAKENLTIPGGVEVHIHLREPGFEKKETIKTGTMAAAKGGYTSVMPMPNLNPHPDNEEVLNKYFEMIEKDAAINVYPYACITKKSKGEDLVDMEMINKKFNINHFSDDGVGVANDEMMKTAMEKAKSIDSLIVAHTEDMSYIKPGASVHAGKMAEQNDWVGIPSEAEYKQIERDLNLAKQTGAKYHICHISAEESVEALRKAKYEGVDASGEVTIHHLLFTENDVKNTNFKMNPPLRTKRDREVLIDALIDGTIDFLANDHAPHIEDEKNREMAKAPFGISNIECAIPLFYTNFVETGKINLEQFVDLISRKPAERFGLKNKGKIQVGYDADITILSEDKKIINKQEFITKGKNTPFDGMEVEGCPIYTICKGELVWKN